ncbi:Protein of unknown function, partial [Gryllus bimaculatus]
NEKQDSLKANDCDFQDYVIVDNDLTTCGIRSVDQKLEEQVSTVNGKECLKLLRETRKRLPS